MTQILQQQQPNHNFDSSSKNTALKNRGPPSPQLSQNTFAYALGDMGKYGLISPSTSTGLLSPSLSESPRQELVVEEDLNAIALVMYMEFMDLVYWKIPGRSGIILAGILSGLILTRYYSLLYVFAASLTILTGFNLIFVNVYNLVRTVWTGLPTQEFLHPYHIHIRHQRSSLLPRDVIDYYIQKSMDILELAAQQTAKIVFVEDTKTTGLACFASAVIYFLTSLIPTKVFFGLLVLALFTAPYYYQQHQDFVDERLLLLQEKYRVGKGTCGAVVRQHAAAYTEQIMTVSVDLGGLLQQQIQKLKQTTNAATATATATTTTDATYSTTAATAVTTDAAAATDDVNTAAPAKTMENPFDTKTEKQ